MNRCVLFTCMGIGLAALCAPAIVPLSPHDRVFVVYNPTDSVPRGWYRIGVIDKAVSLHVGSIVLARLPADVDTFAEQRGYLPSGMPILKRVGAVAPQSVCVVRPWRRLLSKVKVLAGGSQNPEAEGNCVAAKRGGEQPEANWRSAG